MSDITLDSIANSFNLSTINSNFEDIEDVVNNELLHSTGGNNIMGQGLDMNSNPIYNLRQAVLNTEPVRLQEFSDLADAVVALGNGDDNVIVVSISNPIFGAVSDYDDDVGTGTDNSLAIQAAIDFVAARLPDHNRHRGAVFIPAGAYKISSTLSVPMGVSIFGEGATASTIFAENCNGINFTQYGYSIGSMFFEDFGITSVGGNNWAAMATEANASTMDGLYINRMRFYGANEAIIMQANWDCTISNCVFENINQAISLSGGNGQAVRIKIRDNRISYSSGGNGNASAYAIYCHSTTDFTEALHISGNGIYGFDRCINIEQATFVNITDNDLSSTEKAIAFVTSNGTYNIKDNYFEVISGVGIYAPGLGAADPAARTHICNNHFVNADSGTVGIQMNDSGNTNQFNITIRDNTFTGFTSWDVLLYNPGKVLIDNNRCMSSATTNSIYIGSVSTNGPVIVSNNWCKKAIYLDNTADFAAGRVIFHDNVVSDTFTAKSGSWTPADASGAGLILTVTSASYRKDGFNVICEFDITYPSTADTSNTVISGLPFTPTNPSSGATLISYKTDSGLFAIEVGNGVAQLFPRDGSGTRLTNANLSTDRIKGTIIYRTDTVQP